MAEIPIVRRTYESSPSAAERRVERLRLELQAARRALTEAWTGYSDYPTYRATLVATRAEHVRQLEEMLRREMASAA